MKRALAIFLQVAIVALGIGVFTTLLYEPTIEGVNANAASLSEIYFDDPFLAYIYFSFIAVFVGLYQAFKLAGYIGQGGANSSEMLRALRTIRYSALIFAGAMFVAVAYIAIIVRGEDDIAGGAAVGLFLIVVSCVIAAVVRMHERRVQNSFQRV